MTPLDTLERLARAQRIRGTANNTLVSLDCFESDHPLNHAGICGTCHQRLRDTILGVVQRVRVLETIIDASKHLSCEFCERSIGVCIKRPGQTDEYGECKSCRDLQIATVALTPSEPQDG